MVDRTKTDMNRIYRRILCDALIFLAEYHILWCLLNPYLWNLPYQQFEQWFVTLLLIATAGYLIRIYKKAPASFARVRKRLRLMGCFEQYFMIGLFVWFVIDCALQQSWYGGQYFADNSWRLFVTGLSAFAFFPFSQIIGKKRFNRTFKKMIHITVIVFGIFCAWVLWKYLHADYVTFISGKKLSMTPDYSMKIGINQNITAAQVAVLLSLCVYMIATQKIVVKILYLAPSIVFAMVLMLTNSRGGLLAAICTIGSAILLYLWRHSIETGGQGFERIERLWEQTGIAKRLKGSKQNKKTVRIVSIVALAIVCVLVVLLIRRIAFSLLLSGSDPATVGDAGTQQAMRSFNLGLSNRDRIWNAAINLMFSNPITFFFGVIPSQVGQALMDTGIVTFMYPHCHNILLQFGASFGVPAMIGFILFLCSLIRRCIRLIKTQNVHYRRAWALSIIIVCLLVLDIMEAYLFMNSVINVPFFFITAGWIVTLDRSLQRQTSEN